eukprot:gb/GECH01002635.1/.p1 GENE.gb/GECH01002635.1/~~gb/GECH01002635.1/.p1  ORF type:complete len:546 (+),score=178.63 gb/GECH01002635.1/:1-1638(+)
MSTTDTSGFSSLSKPSSESSYKFDYYEDHESSSSNLTSLLSEDHQSSFLNDFESFVSFSDVNSESNYTSNNNTSVASGTDYSETNSDFEKRFFESELQRHHQLREWKNIHNGQRNRINELESALQDSRKQLEYAHDSMRKMRDQYTEYREKSAREIRGLKEKQEILEESSRTRAEWLSEMRSKFLEISMMISPQHFERLKSRNRSDLSITELIQLRVYEEVISVLKNDKEILQEEIDHLKINDDPERDRAYQLLQDSMKEMKSKHDSEKKELRDALNNSIEEVHNLKIREKDLSSRNRDLNDQYQKAKMELEGEITELKTELKLKMLESSRGSMNLEENKRKCNQYNLENNMLKSKLNTMKNEFYKLQNQYNLETKELKSELTTLREKLEAKQKSKSTPSKESLQIEELNHKLKDKENKLKQTKEKLEKLQSYQPFNLLSKKLEEQENQINKQEKKLENYATKIKTLKSEKTVLKKDIKTLLENQNTVKNLQSALATMQMDVSQSISKKDTTFYPSTSSVTDSSDVPPKWYDKFRKKNIYNKAIK